MITRDYLTQRRAELVKQHDQAQRQAEQSRAAALQLSGSIIQIDELIAILAPAGAPHSDEPPAQPPRGP